MTEEPVIYPDLRICDPHHHLMDNHFAHYFIEDLLNDLKSGHNVASTIYMECGTGYRKAGKDILRPVGEVEYVVGLAAPAGVMQGIVAYADLRLGEAVEEVLDTYESIAKNRLCGIRFMSAWDPDPSFNHLPHQPQQSVLRDPAFRRGAKAVGRRGLPVDCWMYGHQLGDLVYLAQALPDQVFVLDHLGTPLVSGPYRARGKEVFAAWRRDMILVAGCPNVMLKLGGLTLEMQGGPWSATNRPTSAEIAELWQHDVQWCIETFGAARCMFESNAPIEGPVADYRTLWNALKRIAAGYSDSEKNGLFHDNATRIYLSRGEVES